MASPFAMLKVSGISVTVRNAGIASVMSPHFIFAIPHHQHSHHYQRRSGDGIIFPEQLNHRIEKDGGDEKQRRYHIRKTGPSALGDARRALDVRGYGGSPAHGPDHRAYAVGQKRLIRARQSAFLVEKSRLLADAD